MNKFLWRGSYSVLAKRPCIALSVYTVKWSWFMNVNCVHSSNCFIVTVEPLHNGDLRDRKVAVVER